MTDKAHKQDTEFSRVLSEGDNCWCIEESSSTSVIIDTASYFAAFAEACQNARNQILILGWDFDRREQLFRDQKPDNDLPAEIGSFLVELVKRRPNLNIYLLSWDFNMIYATEREILPALKLRLQAPPRFHFRLDDEHPGGASHHQKVVVIDDQIAFVGGIDLSRWRWDTCEHKPNDPRRMDPDGKPYPPFHDMMMLVEGKIASRLGDLARQRWHRSHGWQIKPVTDMDVHVWPESVERQLQHTRVAIARTEPSHKGRSEVREVEQLYLDAINAAEKVIYIENQYFTSRCIAEALGKRLAEADGPEIILVFPMRTGGWLEQMTMDVLRSRVVAEMQKADEHGRLRIYFPYQPDLGDDECISVHSKLIIVDDHFLRIGSSNTSNRSMGLDTECDLAIEAKEQDDAVSNFIRDTRLRLLCEHLDCSKEQLDKAESKEGSAIAAIESLQDDGRSLRSLDCIVSDDIDGMVPDSGVIDPPEPFSPDYFVDEYVPEETRSTGHTRLYLFIGIIVSLLLMAAAWRWTPMSDWLSPERIGRVIAAFSSPEIQVLIAMLGFVIASLLMVPITLLAVVSGIVFDGWVAFAVILAAALLSSALGFVGGSVLSRGMIERLSGSRLKQLSKRLAERGTVAVALLRLVPIAPFAVFNLVAGASHLGFRQFIVGSLLGFAPGLGAITLFSNTLWKAVTNPSWQDIIIATGLGCLLMLLAWLVKRWLRSG